METPHIVCGHCNGQGHIPLHYVSAQTLALLRKQKQPISGAALARIAGVKSAAMSNRLQDLRSKGFAEYKRSGQEKRWWAL